MSGSEDYNLPFISASHCLEKDEESGLLEVAAAQEDKALRLEAHRGEKLMAHCLQVAIYAQRLIREMPLRLPQELTREIVEKLAFLAGACHDFGKATNRFQTYLHTDDWHEKKRLKADPLTRHALLGAVVAHTILTRSDLEKGLRATSLGRVLRLAPFWVIRRHHGNLLDLQEDTRLRKREDTIELLSKQLDDCPQEEFDRIIAQIAKVGGFTLQQPVTHTLLKSVLEDILLDVGIDSQDVAAIELEKLKQDSVGSLAPWLLLQQLFSVLLAADKSYAAVEIRRPVSDAGMSADWVAQYRAGRFTSSSGEVNAWRTEVAQIASRSIKAAPTDASFFQLTLPTGLGKTLIALDCALRLRSRLQEAAPFKRTIIYALPFLTILEQAAGVYDELFASALCCEVKELSSELMIRHHHLAEMRYLQGDHEFNPNQSQLMVEGWRSTLVMTSTIQLFQSLFSGRNRTTRKLHRLAGAIVVLDEVQSIPFKYWPLMRQVMRALNFLFDTRFILVTATQPRFLEMSGEAEKAVELVSSYKDYFERLDRTVTKFDLTPRSLESFAEIVTDKLRHSYPQQDALIVVNTVKAAVTLFDLLSSQFGEAYELVHLSTNIIPNERASRIARIKECEGRTRPVIVVSTQLVEAGVDLSFPVLFRDFAPFSAIVQAAGRANRNGEYASRGTVYVYKLIDDKGQCMAAYIYDLIELTATEEVLRRMSTDGFEELTEAQLIAGIEAYFTEIRPKSTQESHKVLAGAKALCFKSKKNEREPEALESFRLIKDKDVQEVFIEIDELAAEAWHNYNELLNKPFNPMQSLEESFVHAGELRAARIRCLPFMLSVPRKYFFDSERAEEREDEICYYEQKEINQVYDLKTGWRRIETL